MKYLTKILLLALTMSLALSIHAQKKKKHPEPLIWLRVYHFDVNDDKHPRILLIGDSICHAYSRQVSKNLKGKSTVSYLATSRCITDKNYKKELSIVLDNSDFKYALIHFNNGLHTVWTDDNAWQKALRSTLEFIKVKAPDAKLIWATSTPTQSPKGNETVIKLNQAAAPIIKEYGIPTNDLYTLTMNNKPETLWKDGIHYHPPGVQLQADHISKVIENKLNHSPEESE